MDSFLVLPSYPYCICPCLRNHLQDVLKKSFAFVFVRRLQGVLKTSQSRRMYLSYSYVLRRRLPDVLKTSWPRRKYLPWSYVFNTTSRRFQDIFNTSSGLFCKNVLPRRLKDDFETSSRRIAKMSSRHLQDVFKTYHQVKLFFFTCI